MTKPLIIVESPAKAITIKKYLDKRYNVLASVGHIKDLPKNQLGVDLNNGFTPQYEVIKGKGRIIKDIKKAAEESSEVYLAPDPDREGEAIAWHIYEEIVKKNPRIFRVLFNEITKSKIEESLLKPEKLDEKKYDAQVARRVLDRLVGYKLSPLLWEKVRRGLSAGRVQSVALRIICDREKEVVAFVKEEFWKIAISVKRNDSNLFTMQLSKIAGKSFRLCSQEETDKVLEAIAGKPATISSIVKKERARRPYPPFITSSLQMEAANRYKFSAKKTMMLAQRLYEGVSLGGGTVSGLITYMRTDSVRISAEAITQVRDYISSHFNANYLPPQPQVYKSKKGAQDAHEAIRPTSLAFEPEKVKAFLPADQFKLYELIWKRFIACQMKPAFYDQTVVDASIGDHTFRATGTTLNFDGFLAIYRVNLKEDRQEEEIEDLPPGLTKGDPLIVASVSPTRHFTQPPPRYSESTLVKELEDNGIGRPSTYATILSTIRDKKYVVVEEGRFIPSELGTIINDLLVLSFPRILNVEFTAGLEDQLDDIERGATVWQSVISTFYEGFAKDLSEAKENMRNVKREEIPTDLTCTLCGQMMVIKWGKNGQFLACSGYPECKNTNEFKKDEHGAIVIIEDERTGESCPTCSSNLVIKRGKFGRFIACSNYPTCRYTRSITTGVSCIVENCKGVLTEKRTRKGRVFYGCNQYPSCTFAIWDKPVNRTCPSCNAKIMVEKQSKSGETMYLCISKNCGYKQSTKEGSTDSTE